MITPDPSRATRMLSVSIWLAWLKHSLALPAPEPIQIPGVTQVG